MTPEDEMQAHFDAHLKQDFARIFQPAKPAPATISRQQEGRVIRIVADETVSTRDFTG